MKKIVPLITESELRFPYYVMRVSAYEMKFDTTEHVGSPYHLWVFCTRGRGMLQIGDKEYTLSPNSGALIYPGSAYKLHLADYSWETCEFSFGGSGVPLLLDILGITQSTVFNISNMQLLKNIFNDIYISIQLDSHVRAFKCSEALYRFLMEFKNFAATDESRAHELKVNLLKPVLCYIEENYHSAIPLEDMAEIINVSVFNLSRLFKQAYNISPNEYLINYRLQKAREILMDSKDVLIKDVAGKVGYRNIGHFCTIFKEYEGMTPMQFKKLHHNI